MVVLYDKGERPFYCSEAQAEILGQLARMKHGGIGNWVHGYRPTTGYLIPPIEDIQILTHFSLAKVYQRRKEALNSITYGEVAEAAAMQDKLKHLTAAQVLEYFKARRAMLVKSMVATLSGDRGDNYRQGFDRCYIHAARGIRINVKSVRHGNIMEPVLVNNTPVAEGILVTYLELGKIIIQPGKKRPPPNSGAPVLIGNIIESKLNARSVDIKTLSLKSDNFISLEVGDVIVRPPQ